MAQGFCIKNNLNFARFALTWAQRYKIQINFRKISKRKSFFDFVSSQDARQIFANIHTFTDAKVFKLQRVQKNFNYYQPKKNRFFLEKNRLFDDVKDF